MPEKGGVSQDVAAILSIERLSSRSPQITMFDITVRRDGRKYCVSLKTQMMIKIINYHDLHKCLQRCSKIVHRLYWTRVHYDLHQLLFIQVIHFSLTYDGQILAHVLHSHQSCSKRSTTRAAPVHH